MEQMTDIGDAMRRIAGAWWQTMPPAEQWTESSLVWFRVDRGIWREMQLTWADGRRSSGTMPDEVQDALIAYQDVFGGPGQPRPFGARMRLTSSGDMESFVNWNDRLYFHSGPEAPYGPPADPSIELVPTDEMWRAELQAHPRPAEQLPDWLRPILGG